MKVSEVNSSQPTDSEQSKGKQVEKAAKKEKINLQAEKKDNKNQNPEEKKVTKENVEEGVEKLNDAIQAFHEDLQFELHEESERMMTKLVNLEKNEVIKEIPPKELLDMLGRIKDMVGLVLDEKI